MDLQLYVTNFKLSISVKKRSNLCKKTSDKIIEAFQDGMEREATAANPIFCEPLNGRQVGFPLDLEEFLSFQLIQSSYLKRYSLEEFSSTINAKSYVSVID